MEVVVPDQRVIRIREMVLAKASLDQTIYSLKNNFRRTLVLLEQGFLPAVHLEMINLAVGLFELSY